MRSASSNAVSAFARSPFFHADSPSMKCPHTLRGCSPVYCSNSFVASLKYPAWYAASPSANETSPVMGKCQVSRKEACVAHRVRADTFFRPRVCLRTRRHLDGALHIEYTIQL